MFRIFFGRLVTETGCVYSYVIRAPFINKVSAASVSIRCITDTKDEAPQPFNTPLLNLLVCPLSKKPLRYEAETNELINEEFGIAYPITGGIPNMIPQEARFIQKDSDTSTTQTQG